jgi:hypothetical protein
MIGHEIFGLLGLIVGGAIVLGALNNGTNTSKVLSSSFQGFGNLLNAMEGFQMPAGTAQAA